MTSSNLVGACIVFTGGLVGATKRLRGAVGVNEMGKQLQGRVAIVTGASSGIGRGIAEVFASEGAKTVLVARRAELLEEVAAGIKAKGRQALALPADLTKETEIVELFRKSVQTYGRLDVLVNNAGIATHKNTEDISIDYWNDALAINITAPFLCAREAIRIMKEQTPKGGRIIISSHRSFTQVRHCLPSRRSAAGSRPAGVTIPVTITSWQRKMWRGWRC
jgi:hypothetical protein